LSGFFATPDELAAVSSAAIVRNLELGRTPFDAMREHRLNKSWCSATSMPMERVRAGQALVHMGSPRYVAAIKERLLAAEAQQDVSSIAYYLEELQRLAASRRELMPIFLDLLEHEDQQKRYFAVFQIGELALRGVELAPRILEELLGRSEDASAEIREQLAHALGKLTTSDAFVRRSRRPLSACSGTQPRASASKLSDRSRTVALASGKNLMRGARRSGRAHWLRGQHRLERIISPLAMGL
jgi:HEAT repeat protein